jgi:hypothetical protein
MTRPWSATAVISTLTGLLILLSLASTAAGFSSRAILLNENQVLYLFSTSGQVIAGIYGLTLTGFVFFRSELSREEFEDQTLAEAVEALKQRYFSLLVFVTALVVITILLANFAISYEANNDPHGKVVVINVAQSFFVTSLLAVAYFVFDVISPKRIESASRTLQNEVDPKRSEKTTGGLEEFLRNYNQIEAFLAEAGQPYQQGAVLYDAKYPRRISNARLAEILLRNERIDERLFSQIRELITLRNAIIHGAEPVVSSDVVQTSAQVSQALQKALIGPPGDET